MVELPTRPNPTLVMVQVGETRNKREALASQIIAGVLLPQFLVIPAHDRAGLGRTHARHRPA